MKQLFAALLVASFAVGASAQTAPASAPGSAKAHPCVDAAQAKGLKGDEAKKAIAQCRADRDAKKATCQEQTKGTKGKQEHAAAMKECMAK